MLYMLDTNACIGLIKNNPPSLRQHLIQLDVSQVAISCIVLYELEYGVCRSQQVQRNRENLDSFLKYIQVLEWSEEQSSEAALLRCELMQIGQPIGHYDVLIAAHARSLKATLVTHNVGEFGRVKGLLVEDWE
ncbi:MAG: type II toxin-antitoxin system VapC family toxin [Thiolinea sp.]